MTWRERAARGFLWAWRCFYAGVGALCAYLAVGVHTETAAAGGVALFCFATWLLFMMWGFYCMWQAVKERIERGEL